jgi:hypothetical protein
MDLRRALLLFACLGAVAALAVPASAAPPPPNCAPGQPAVTGHVDVTTDDAKTYQVRPFQVGPGTTTVRVEYDWGNTGPGGGTPLTATTIDLGVWDEDGYRAADGFRGWGGSRHKTVKIAADSATRSFKPGPVKPGTWWLEFGVAAVAPDGGWYEYSVTCTDPPVGATPAYDPVDPDHVANRKAGWYHGDFHMHGYHSNPAAPSYDEFVAFARKQQLDFFPLTEYVTDVHWGQLGPYQRANPDVLFWPGREIITYYGHVLQFGATPGAIEYRHGFEDITINDIVADARAKGALLGVGHPTTFEQPGFESFCRGCAWELEEEIGWDRFSTFEVAQGPQVVRPDPGLPGIENPFTSTAIDLWEDILNEGVFLTAVGASDDKLSGQGSGPTYTPHGIPATAVYSSELSLRALRKAVTAGHVYVRTRGVANSPAVELTVTTPDGQKGRMGDSFRAKTADAKLEISGAAGQGLRIFRDGDLIDVRPILTDEFTYTFAAPRRDDSPSRLGTWYRIETFDEQGRTTILNPFFLTGAKGGGAGRNGSGANGSETGPDGGVGAAGGSNGPTLPATGGSAAVVGIIAMLGAAMLRRR